MIAVGISDVLERRTAQPLPGLQYSDSLSAVPRAPHAHDGNHQLCAVQSHHSPQRRLGTYPCLHRRGNYILLRHASEARGTRTGAFPKDSNYLYQ